jgi:acetoin utilization deacetylase AcuC-like enzyme
MTVLHERFPFIECTTATDADILRCHTNRLLEQVRTTRGWIDRDTICTQTTYEAALLSAGAAIDAVRYGGFAIARPPGHHAERDRAMGFCLFDNVAIAAHWAQAKLGLGRVAIVDWDVHHGNGTQDIVADDPTIFFASLHQWPLYPGTGGADEQSDTLLNIPLRPGTGDAGYSEAWSTVERAVLRFAPQLDARSPGRRRARRRVQPAHAPRPRRCRARRFQQSPLDAQTAGSLSRPSAAEGRRTTGNALPLSG